MGFPFKFGTAGIRARAGEAPGELNLRSVRVIADAIARALAEANPSAARTLCVGFDGRRDSQAFAAEVCAVALAHAYRVYCFESPNTTPLLAFSVRARAALAGVMITASHNPPADNGVKLYVAGGRQLSAPLDQAIEGLIAAQDDPDAVPRADLEQARATGLLSRLGEDQATQYLDELVGLLPNRLDLPLPQLAYSALCGVGSPVAEALFARLGADHVAHVTEQAAPRADFGGLRSPNPEEPSALVALLELAERKHAALAFAHDPDADRLAVLARDANGALRALSGDEVGALIGDFLLSLHPRPEHTLLVSTLVSGGLLERICASRGAAFLRTPTGFKWIAKLGREAAGREGRELLFGYEEALGYAFFAHGDDKDGSAALVVLCELERRLHARGASLVARLNELLRNHGVFVTRPLNVSLPGADGPAQVTEIMQRLRTLDPSALLPEAGALEDHTRSATPLPLLVFYDALGTRVCVRPSGTEPKLKLYLHAVEEVVASDATGALGVEQARARAVLRLDALAATLAPLLRA